jgi:arylsulfatase A-like enzyme/Tfp pilus assembly protein PilF
LLLNIMSNGKHSRLLSRRQGLWLVLVVAALVGLLAWGMWGQSRRPHVLLITLDTTRADRIGCYGHSPALTPTLDALAASGVLFERAYTPIPMTLPAHASLMTGLYPREHGLITNGRGRLDDQIPTLAEQLRNAGYDTAAFVGSFVLHSKFGLQRGFATYDDDLTDTDPTEHGLHRQRDGRQVVDAALAWLQQDRAQPFFGWVHLYDPHHPYDAHAGEFGDRFQAQPYDGELAYVDRQVSRLLDQLERQGLRDRTLIVIVGDHGESLGEHEEHEHGLTLYNGALHVPWIWAGWGVTSSGRRVPQPVSLIDFRLTLLEVLGLSDAESTSGGSLRPALAGEDIAAEACYAATDEPLLAQGWSPLRSLTTERWKYIRSPEPELYDLTNDPQELHNLAADRAEEVRDWDDQLVALEETMTVRTAADVELSSKERQALASLGYLGGATPAPQPTPAGEPLPDVKRMLPFYNRVVAAYQLLVDGDAAGAETRLRELCNERPGERRSRLSLASVLQEERKFSESREVLEDILRQDSDDAEALFQLGTVSWSQERYAEAAEEFRKSLVIEPGAARGLFSLARALHRLGKPEEAEHLFREAIDEDPGFLNARLYLGTLLAGQRRTAEAEFQFREAVKQAPRSVEAHFKLAMLLTEQNRPDEAGRHLAQTVKLAPESADLRFQYGVFLLSRRRFAEGVQALEETLRLDPQHAEARRHLEQARRTREGTSKFP